MPREFSYRPDWEPYRHVVKVRLTSTQLNYLNSLCARYRVTRSWLVRKSLECGMARAVDDLRRLEERGFRTRVGAADKPVATLRRGPRARAVTHPRVHARVEAGARPLAPLPAPDPEED